MTLPLDVSSYQREGLKLRALESNDITAMLELQQAVIAALPDPRWYVPSEREEFIQVVAAHEGFGYFLGERLCGFAELSPGVSRMGGHSYAEMLGKTIEGSYDFHDVMTHPSFRSRGMHTSFLRLFQQMVQEENGRWIYATVDPENVASWNNFEKAGYELLIERPAYDGRARRFYRLTLKR
ncbi:MAG: GNAT family protein [Eubacteriales bacterium]|nr:GNAT family protein [Eubacteriales bacterium]